MFIWYFGPQKVNFFPAKGTFMCEYDKEKKVYFIVFSIMEYSICRDDTEKNGHPYITHIKLCVQNSALEVASRKPL